MAPAATATVKAVKREIPFAWEGRDKRGARIKGRSLAPDEQTLRAELRRQGVAPSKIRKQRQGRKGDPGFMHRFLRVAFPGLQRTASRCVAPGMGFVYIPR